MKTEEEITFEISLLKEQRDVVNNIFSKTDDEYMFVEVTQEKINTLEWVLN